MFEPKHVTIIVQSLLFLFLGVLLGALLARPGLQQRLRQRFQLSSSSGTVTHSIQEQLLLAQQWRQQGLYDQAIALHQQLLAACQDAALDARLRHELALDFFEAGLLDRAESLWLGLMPSSQAMTWVARLYAQTHDWQAMADLLATQRLDDELRLLYLHACCELVGYYRRLGITKQADRYWQQAQKIQPGHLRVQRLSLIEQGQPEPGKPEWVPLPPWRQLLATKRFRKASEYRQLLQSAHQQQVSLTVLYDALRANDLLHPRFSCRQCGYEAKEHSWQCPQCQSWETLDSSD